MRIFLFSVFCLSLVGLLKSQDCVPDPRPPLFFEDFGSGDNFGPPLAAGTTNYAYGSINDGSYVLSNTSGLNGNFWHNGIDNTAGDVDGYMLVLNAADGPGVFYQRTFDDLCPNTNYVFSAYIANLVVPIGCIGVADRPDIRFTVLDSIMGNTQFLYDTGEIFYSSFLTWNEYSIIFRTEPGQTSAHIKLTNNAMNFCGNDLAIDDVSLRYCNIISEQTFDLCDLPDGSITVGENVYTEPGTYLDAVPVPNSCNDTLITTTLMGMTRRLPLEAYTFCEGESIEVGGQLFTESTSFVDTLAGPSPDCPLFQAYEISEVSSLSVSQEVSLCPGEGLQVGDNYYTNAGNYVDVFTSGAGCDSIVNTSITSGGISIAVTPSEVEVESGTEIQLMSTVNMANSYELSWQPAEAFSCTDCLDPILRPTTSGEFTLTATDLISGCTATASVKVTIPSCEQVFVPTAFSPNRDGVNDRLAVYAEPCFTRLIHWRVFDRWGALVYEADDETLTTSFEGWDGFYQGKVAAAGVYGYYLLLEREDGTQQLLRGDVMVLY